jgi:hypothetical protein
MKRKAWMKATSRWSQVRYKATFSGYVKSGTSRCMSERKKGRQSQVPTICDSCKTWERAACGELTQTSAVLLRLAQHNLLQLALLRAFRTALPSRCPLLLQFGIMPCEPYVRDEFVELGQRECAAALRVLLRNSVEEKSVKIGCRLKIPDFSQRLFFPASEGDKI